MRKCFFCVRGPGRGLPVLFLLLLFQACKSPPPPPPGEIPAAALVFDHIEADSIDHVVLFYRLRLENPRSLPLTVELKDWNSRINGAGAADSAFLNLEGESPGDIRIRLEGFSSAEKTFALGLDLAEIRKRGGTFQPPEVESPEDEYLAELTLNLSYLYPEAKPLPAEISAATAFPRVREPEFTITSIAILQAELINTRFAVNLRIDNPNAFPLSLSSFEYELYGEGRFWAGGREENIMIIPAKGSEETKLFLLMNFINMERRLLDEVIAMSLVRYRFHGKTEIGTGFSWLSRFRVDFDLSGSSEVFK
jgi:LEA14-like dessication related protein